MKRGHFSIYVVFLLSLLLTLGGAVLAQVPDGEMMPENVASDTNVKPTGTKEATDSVPLPPLGVYKRETISQKLRPIPYPYLRESDVLWSKIIWRAIDLRQKLNFPLYYPTVRMRDRKSLAQALYDAILNKEIYAYDPDKSLTSPGDEFVSRMTPDEARQKLCGPDRKIEQQSMTTGLDTVWYVPASINWAEIKQILVKEEWYFDSKRSVLEVRVIGICPVREYYETIEDASGEGITGELRRQPVFWVYYPEARRVLAKVAFYNPKNDAQVSSYDDLFFKRRFGSYVIRESNEYNNRAIADYKVGGIPNMQEADRVYYDIFNKEHDLWEY